MACRLQEPFGPEIILVLPKTTEGWLEHKAMDGARHRLLHELWKADRYKRLGVYYPVTAGGKPIYVHAKILTMDDKLLRVGSSNLNNRSMSFDTECDRGGSDRPVPGQRKCAIRSWRFAEILFVNI